MGLWFCLFHVSQLYLGFCPHPKHFIVQYLQNIVKYGGGGGGGGIWLKTQYTYKILE